ncbi:ComEC/Rec2 family competence protein [Pseudoglutamicibacter albus]|uniref:ComEC/Rec2 family competence protein n=1 Tax=Pseudoglutamicibacter albus TaxID=98671 RepID=UPI003618E892
MINTGDLESEQAQLMLRSHKLERSTGDLRVLKVAHHGSATGGTELIEEFQPDLALIGVGADNDYGHPRQVILEALYRANVSVHRTDQEGTIIVRPVSGTEEADNRVGAQVLHERSPAGSIR